MNNYDQNEEEIYEGDGESGEADFNIIEYEISASPNDFNIRTLYDFIDSGIVKIPGFQRNYVWDIKRASKLIESLLIGIPIPQIFLYEQAKNSFLVIDGQQRYFTIYFFKKKRFPRKEKRFELRQIFEESKGIPDEVLFNDEYFVDFNLQLAEQLPERKNKFNKKNYSTLSSEDVIAFDLRTIRNIIIKQNSPEDGDSVIFEIFNRLNSGGVNLRPQEIRTSLYHSKFYDMLYTLNLNENWRKMTPKQIPDLNMKDIEILLRGFAMLINHTIYTPSLTKFLNSFSTKAKKFDNTKIMYLKNLFEVFIDELSNLDEKAFFGKGGRFNISVFESLFVAVCEDAYLNNNLDIRQTTVNKIDELKSNPEFVDSTQTRTSNSPNVKLRIVKAKEIL
jgi:uncharacterized protein with ParB-like and HNH nuclease domain